MAYAIAKLGQSVSPITKVYAVLNQPHPYAMQFTEIAYYAHISDQDCIEALQALVASGHIKMLVYGLGKYYSIA